jgi:cytidine deaminase
LSGSERRKQGPAGERRRSDRRTADRPTRVDLRERDPGGVAEDFRTRPDRRAAERRTGRDRRSESGWQPIAIDPGGAAAADPSQALLAAATDARTRAQARYSGFKVGAALETIDGQVISGCNIENATYGLTLCAERVALVKALSDGHGVFTAIAVVADTIDPTPPCGPCRQLLWEYCGDIEVILGNLDGPRARYRLSALLPLPFDARLLK